MIIRDEIKQDLLQIIRDAMKPKTSNKTTQTAKTIATQTTIKSTQRTNGKGVQHTKERPTLLGHGQLGDFTRSNSNPVSSGISHSAPVGFEDVSGAGDESILEVIRIAINNTGGAPSKRAAKQMASPKMTRSDRVFQSGGGCGPGSSKSTVIDAIKAINAKETGCLVREQMKDKTTKEPLKPITLTESQRNANTTQGNYNPMIVR